MFCFCSLMECLKGFDAAQNNVEYLHNFISFGISTRDYNQCPPNRIIQTSKELHCDLEHRFSIYDQMANKVKAHNLI